VKSFRSDDNISCAVAGFNQIWCIKLETCTHFWIK